MRQEWKAESARGSKDVSYATDFTHFLKVLIANPI
jgi:hypothetical protein